MDTAFDLVSFLARSENRATALVALASGPCTRPELQDETGVPRATLSRILADFRDRDLATRRGHEYAVTPLGGRVASELESLFGSVESMQALQAVAAWLPLDEPGVDPGDLDDVRVTLAEGVLDFVASDPGLAGRMRNLLADGNAEVFVHEGDVEPQLIIAGRTTMFLVADDEGAIRGLVEIGDGSVLPWAGATFESIKREAEPLLPDAAAELLTA